MGAPDLKGSVGAIVFGSKGSGGGIKSFEITRAPISSSLYLRSLLAKIFLLSLESVISSPPSSVTLSLTLEHPDYIFPNGFCNLSLLVSLSLCKLPCLKVEDLTSVLFLGVRLVLLD